MMDTIKDARKRAGLSQAKMSELFEIPKRTIEEWDRGTRKCPHWAEILIIEKLEKIAADKEKEGENRMWYAVLKDEEDNDWGTGSYDKGEAMEMAERMEALKIAVIEMGDDPTCKEEIYMYDSFRISAIYEDGSNQDGDIVCETGSAAVNRELETDKDWFETEAVEDAKRWTEEEIAKPEYYLISYYREGNCIGSETR